MAKTTRTPNPTTPEPSDMQNQMTVASGGRPFDPTRSREEQKIYNDAQQDNYEHDFMQAIMAARAPLPVPEYKPPTPAPAILEQTRLEMEAGAKRVAEFTAEEEMRKAVHERNRKDKWADKESVEIFRPGDYVPDQKKGQGNVGGASTPV